MKLFTSGISMAEAKTTNKLPYKRSLYEDDFVAWADEQAMLLGQKNWDELDLGNLIEEVRDLGNQYRSALESHLTRLLMHLLKWQFQSEKRTNSWLISIKDARKQISRLIRKHPVLASHLEPVFFECYSDAREDASDETGLAISSFPLECPYGLGVVLDKEFFPSEH